MPNDDDKPQVLRNGPDDDDRYVQITGTLGDIGDTPLDEIVDAFIDFVESKGWTFFATWDDGTNEIVDDGVTERLVENP